MPDKRIVFSTNTANDQGFRIPNDVISFERYKKNPVILRQHKWEEPPLGRMTDIQFMNGEWSGVPVFHNATPESIAYGKMWEEGYINACSIGGFKELKTTGKIVRNKDGEAVPEVWVDEEGIAEAIAFDLYEISMVSIPSNEDAVDKSAALAAKCYDDINIKVLQEQLTTLSSNLITMEAEKAKLSADAEQKQPTKLAGADILPPPVKDIVEKDKKKKGGLAGLFHALGAFLEGTDGSETDGEKDVPMKDRLLGNAPEPTNLPKVVDQKVVIDHNLPDVPNKLEAAKEEAAKHEAAKHEASKEEASKHEASKQEAADKKKADLEEAKHKAEAALEKAKKLKAKAEEEDADDDDKAAFEKAKEEADDAVALCDKMESSMEADSDPAYQEGGKKKKEELSSNRISMKTTEELKADAVKLAGKPQISARVNVPNGLTLSKLKADNNGKKLIDRVQNTEMKDRNIQETGVYLEALRNEPKYKELFSKVRLMQNVSEDSLNSYRQSTRLNGGFGVDQLITKLKDGRASVMGRDNVMREATTLTATDNFLASPDLFAVDFLDLAIFNLFPNSDWKDEVPIFGAQETEPNTGIIWANIAANPTIYMGSSIPSPANYTYTDTAVSLALVPYYLQPMLWNPITMHQLRYDQMGTGWAQAFAVLGTYIDDYLIYTLASTVPHSSIIYSNGLVPATTGVQTFTLNGNGNDPNSFYYNPSFAGTLDQPSLNDIIRIEQLYNKQNFRLEKEKPVVIIDPTTESIISQQAQTQSLLTRWIDEDGKDLQKYKHTTMHLRSRVAAFDPTTAQIKNPFSTIPATATSANLAFIPSQVGIGLGKLDVFMIQDPSSYGYKMSADVRMGIVPLRANYNGTALWAYGPQVIS
jgi:hypothetical protein